jgi:hypothetical protein
MLTKKGKLYRRLASVQIRIEPLGQWQRVNINDHPALASWLLIPLASPSTPSKLYHGHPPSSTVKPLSSNILPVVNPSNPQTTKPMPAMNSSHKTSTVMIEYGATWQLEWET